MNRYIRLNDLLYSDVAIQNGIHNKPNLIQEENLFELIDKLLNPLCRSSEHEIKVKLGFVSKKLNKIFKFPLWNPHLIGFAADIYTRDKYKIDLFCSTYHWLIDNNIPFHEFIIVNNKFDWHIHLSLQDYKGKQKKITEMIQNNKYIDFNLNNLENYENSNAQFSDWREI